MNLKILLTIFLVTSLNLLNYSQDDIQFGSPNANQNYRQPGGVFDYSDPSGINIKIQLWGYVKYPGYYTVPAGISLNELISFAGGPLEDALLDDIRVTNIKEGSQTVMMKYNYNDLMWEDDIGIKIDYVRLEAGDIIIVPGEPRYFVRQDIAFYLGVVTALASVAALIISITND